MAWQTVVAHCGAAFNSDVAVSPLSCQRRIFVFFSVRMLQFAALDMIALVSRTFEQKIERIQVIIDKLHSEDVSLEDNVNLVEEGTKLTSECREYLDKAELSIKKIVDGKEETFQ